MFTLLASIPSPPGSAIVIGPLSLHIYGLCIALGVIASVSIARRRWAKQGGDPEDITTVAIVAIPAGLIGARLYHVITDFPDLYSGGRWWPDAFLIWKGGLGIPGGVLAGAFAALYMARRLKMNWRAMGDAAAPALPVAQAIGRFGNYFNQELFGGHTKLPWGLQVDPEIALRADPSFTPGTLYHPTFLYESLWNFSLAGLIVLLGRKIVLKPGRWFAVYILGYGLGRLWVESLRIDVANEILGLRVNTWTSGLAIIGGTIWLFWRGSPLDKEATAELKAGGDPQATRAAPQDAGDNAEGNAESGAVANTDGGESEGAKTEVDDELAVDSEAAGSSELASADHEGTDSVREARPDTHSPVPEGSLGEHSASDSGNRIDPQEG
ncbi:MAG TPA: prolipoprotein diacylglyceryl transferase, partial [Microthrixaceae bacterium]|nr:prolipoprotein diacylglyceryl transferase [Microthrixaceae bacterium]